MRIDFKDMSRIVGETWRTLTSKERSPYEKQARSETLQYEEERKIFEKKHKIWADLQHKAKASGQTLHPFAGQCLHTSKEQSAQALFATPGSS